MAIAVDPAGLIGLAEVEAVAALATRGYSDLPSSKLRRVGCIAWHVVPVPAGTSSARSR